MYRSFLYLILTLVTSSIFSQSKNNRLQFNEYKFDFGYIKEERGLVSHKFKFTNESKDSVRLIAVENECGCIVTDFSKAMIQPKDTGYVVVTFDPSIPINKEFDKEVIVRGSNDTIILLVKGHVIPVHNSKDVGVFSKHIGYSWMKSNYVQMNFMYSDQVKEMEFDIFNASDSILIVTVDSLPLHISAQPKVDTIPSNQVGTLSFVYNAAKKSSVGYLVDTFLLHTNEDTLSLKTLYVSANIAERFAEELDSVNIPVAFVDRQEINFGSIKKNTERTDSVSLLNKGTDTLFIRRLYSGCSCLNFNQAELKDYLLPGESLTFSITFAAGQKRGNQQKEFYLYTSDPRQAIIKFRIRAYVIK